MDQETRFAKDIVAHAFDQAVDVVTRVSADYKSRLKNAIGDLDWHGASPELIKPRIRFTV